MAYKFFRVAWPDPAAAEAELNGFLRSHRVMKVRQQFVEAGEDSFWSFCVEYVEPRAAGDRPASERPAARSGKERVDYRERLPPEQFDLYLKLRELRKELADADKVAVYLVFTNEQLAQIAVSPPSSKTDLAKIDGVGAARVDKYGDRVVEFCKAISTGGKAAGGSAA
jgi:superfamily II DNA helicase RecQ